MVVGLGSDADRLWAAMYTRTEAFPRVSGPLPRHPADKRQSTSKMQIGTGTVIGFSGRAPQTSASFETDFVLERLPP